MGATVINGELIFQIRQAGSVRLEAPVPLAEVRSSLVFPGVHLHPEQSPAYLPHFSCFYQDRSSKLSS